MRKERTAKANPAELFWSGIAAFGFWVIILLTDAHGPIDPRFEALLVLLPVIGVVLFVLALATLLSRRRK